MRACLPKSVDIYGTWRQQGSESIDFWPADKKQFVWVMPIAILQCQMSGG